MDRRRSPAHQRRYWNNTILLYYNPSSPVSRKETAHLSVKKTWFFRKTAVGLDAVHKEHINKVWYIVEKQWIRGSIPRKKAGFRAAEFFCEEYAWCQCAASCHFTDVWTSKCEYHRNLFEDWYWWTTEMYAEYQRMEGIVAGDYVRKRSLTKHIQDHIAL